MQAVQAAAAQTSHKSTLQQGLLLTCVCCCAVGHHCLQYAVKLLDKRAGGTDSPRSGALSKEASQAEAGAGATGQAPPAPPPAASRHASAKGARSARRALVLEEEQGAGQGGGQGGGQGAGPGGKPSPRGRQEGQGKGRGKASTSPGEGQASEGEQGQASARSTRGTCVSRLYRDGTTRGRDGTIGKHVPLAGAPRTKHQVASSAGACVHSCVHVLCACVCVHVRHALCVHTRIHGGRGLATSCDSGRLLKHASRAHQPTPSSTPPPP